MSKLKTVEVRNLAGVHEVTRACGGIPRSTLIYWRNHKTDPFPKPIKALKSGELWDLAHVREWLERRNKRLEAKAANRWDHWRT